MSEVNGTPAYVVDRRSGTLEPSPDYSDPNLIPLPPEAEEKVHALGVPDEVVMVGPDSVALRWKQFRVDPEAEVRRLCGGGLDDGCSDAEKEEIRWRDVRPEDVVKVSAVEAYVVPSLALPLAVVDGFFRLLGTDCGGGGSKSSSARDVGPDTPDTDSFVDTICTIVAGGKTLTCGGDEDGDLIPNEKDKCPLKWGSNTNHGCPEKPIEDTSLPVTDVSAKDSDAGCETMQVEDKQVCMDGDEDGDGTKNVFDVCPEIPGPPWEKGCPTDVNHPPVLDPIGNKTIQEGKTLKFSLSATDPDGDDLTFGNQGLPFGAVLSVGGDFEWTPGFSQAGSYQVNFMVDDGFLSDQEKIKITVLDVNQPPVLQPIGDKTVKEGEELKFSVFATDPDGDSILYGAVPLPSGAKFNQNSGVFKWIPDFKQMGTYVVDFSATAGGKTVTQKVTINVLNVNRPPTLQSIKDKVVNEGQPLKFPLLATDPDGDLLTFGVKGLPVGAKFNSATGVFDWTPNFSQAGDYTVAFNVSDGKETTNEEVGIKVLNVDQAPVLIPIGDKVVNEGQPLSFKITATDPDGDLIAYSAEPLPKGAQFNQTTGIFQWTPSFAQSGKYTINFSAVANGQTTTQKAKITVININQAPVLNPIGNKVVNTGNNLSFTISAVDTDGGVVTYKAVSLPQGATFNSNTGSFQWKPDYFQTGNYQVTFKASDGQLEDSETIMITVKPSFHIERVSVKTGGGEVKDGVFWYPILNANGNFALFTAATLKLFPVPDKKFQIYLHNRKKLTTELISKDPNGVPGDGSSGGFAGGNNRFDISDDGRYVVFPSFAKNLVPGDTNPAGVRIYVYDRQTGLTKDVSLGAVPFEGGDPSPWFRDPSISGAGNHVVFAGDYLYLHSLLSGATQKIPLMPDGWEEYDNTDISWDSSVIVSEVYVYDKYTNNSEFQIYAYNQLTKKTSLASSSTLGTSGNDGSYYPHVSADGRYVVFESEATNLVPNDTNGVKDVFVKDLLTGALERISMTEGSKEANGESIHGTISADSRYVAFESNASNLVSDDFNGVNDIFVKDRWTGVIKRVSLAYDKKEANAFSKYPSISADGKWVVFSSYATNLIPLDTNQSHDIFVVGLEYFFGK